MEAFNIGTRQTLFDTFTRGIEWLDWELGVARAVLNDFDWFRAWALEVNQKQLELFKILRSATPRST
jgi:hypothetical protein